MKKIVMNLILLVATQLAPAPAQTIGEGMAVVPVDKVRQEAPLFYSVETETTVSAGDHQVLSQMQVKVKVHQGRPEKLTLELTGEGEVEAVEGGPLKSWSVRSESDGRRFLDIFPALPAPQPQPWQPRFDLNPWGVPGEHRPFVAPPLVDGPKEFVFEVRGSHEFEGRAPFGAMIPGPGEAVGFSSSVKLQEQAGFRVKVVEVRSLALDDDTPEGVKSRYLGRGLETPALRLQVVPSGSVGDPLELLDPQLVGKLSKDGGSIAFTLTASVRVREEGASIGLLDGGALTSGISGAGWHVKLAQRGDRWVYELVGNGVTEAPVPLRLRFDVAVNESNDWRSTGFRLPAGVVVPVRLEGVGEKVIFDAAQPVRPEWSDGAWLGFLNAAGEGAMRWKAGAREDEGALFFSSNETAEVRVGAGLLRQHSRIDFRVLQGKLESLRFAIEGDGEVLAVNGDPVLGWSVSEEGGGRFLDVRLSRPIEGEEGLVLRTQSALGAFPVKASPMRLRPVDSLRHSGHVRIANEGAVRLEVVETKGMMQLAPAQFPGGAAPEGLRQIFVYRFPAGDYRYVVAADQVLPEVGVAEVTIHEMGETDRRILSDLELDIREAPIREWTVGIPEGFAVAEVSGASVADYSLASEAKDGIRELKILFSDAVSGRQLVSLRLERNEGAATGDWVLQRLRHDEAKSTRGYLGVAAAPGYRVVAGEMSGLVETPVDYFPKKMARLQQAFRIREGEWAATMGVEALGQSVQADVFHLYTLREGVAYGSVVLNYFVVGAPASEWRIKVPEGIGNIVVTGQGVGRDWRQEGGELIVPLARPALGGSTLLVTFEQPMSARGGVLRPGELRPLGVQGERGYVQVTSPLQVDYEISSSKGSVLRIDASELPTEYRLLTGAPTLEAWQYTAGDLDLEMNVKWYENGEAVGEVIDFASLESHVSRDNQVVTTAKLFARSKGAATLEIELPPDAKLWETRVAGERVNARKAGDRILVPLPRRLDPESAVEVELRYGRNPGEGGIRLVAPKVGTATAVAKWTIRGDEGRQLVPDEDAKSGAQLVRPVLTETGAEWISTRGRMGAAGVLVLAALGLVIRRIPKLRWLGVAILVGAAVASFGMAGIANGERRVMLGVLEYSAPAVLAGEELFVELSNVAGWEAIFSGWGAFVAVVGVALLIWALLRAVGRESHVTTLVVIGFAAIAWGVLAQHGGAIAFFALFGLALLVLAVVPFLRRSGGPGAAPPKAAAAAASMIALFAMMPAPADAAEALERIEQKWSLSDGVLDAGFEVRVRATEPGERFLLLAAPATLTGFDGAGLSVVKEGRQYFLVSDGAGVGTGRGSYEMRIADAAEGWKMPTGPAAVQTVFARHDREGWEFQATGAARLQPGREVEGEEGHWTEIRLTPGTGHTFRVRPEQRDASQEETRFFTEVSDLFLPGPGVVNGIHGVEVRPAQGLVRELSLMVPEGFTVGDVVDGPVGRWRFNPDTRRLRVSIEPAQQAPFAFRVATQRATGVLPVDLSLAPLRVEGGAGSVGMIGLAFGDDAQPEAVQPAGLGAVNLDDFPGVLLPKDGEGRPLALLQRAFRYGADEASVSLKVAPVAPELRVETKQTLSIGDDRMVLAVDLTARITRAGIFRLTADFPEGLEVESATGAALSHWTVNDVEGGRVLTLNLNGRTLGEQTFAISLAGASPGTRESWSVPRLTVREAARQRGTLTVVPDRGLQVRSVSREQVSQLDPGEMGVPRPGALAFRLLQADWALALAVRELDPWVTAKVMHEVTLREGQALTRARLVYRIENAARKALRVRLPGLDERAAATVRASGPAVGDFVPIEGEEDLWEIRFQRGVAGETTVDVEFQRQSGDEAAVVEAIELLEVRQVSYFAGIKAGGRLDAALEGAVTGWQKIDWTGVPPELREGSGSEIPDFVFRVAEPEGALRLRVDRHDLAGSQPLRVRSGKFVTLVSPTGSAMTGVTLKIDVSEKSTLRLKLPQDVSPFNLLVNGEGVPLVRDGDVWLFYITPSPLGEGPAELAFTYATEDERPGTLLAPKFDIPLENLVWEVFVPEGWEIGGSDGSFELVQSEQLGDLGLESYLKASSLRSREGREQAQQESREGFAQLASGNQEKAVQLLGKAARNDFLDEASKEDARVQYRNLKMQQAVLGLNTRRQRNYLDNGGAADIAPNRQLEQAAEENPILQGQFNFDPQQFDRLMVGNTVEETTALKEIASAIVGQQLEVMPAPQSLEVELIGQGRMFRFERSLQLVDDEAMTLELELRRQRAEGWGFAGIVGLLAGAVLVVGLKRREE
ncbi:hypothetical protein [Haloferula sp. A504]|uniref:hypothetical protein n=1 Tax=Haloferula sp. A504 TaxID=3373601 RepID=UPI0031BCAC0E|nr:hypothetical protein [Verrucomicrobiaceae bacterium E54]